MVRRAAFTFIELIFAIVVIAVSVLSLPVMNQVISKGTDSALIQEAIFAAATELNQVVTYRWDENSLESTSPYAKVLRVNANDCNASIDKRAGHIVIASGKDTHRMCTHNTLLRPSVTLGKDGGDLDDIDDNIKSLGPLYVGTADAQGYKKTGMKSKIDVAYAAFNDITATEKNMKKITVTVVDEDGNDVVVLSTYSANIGEVEYYTKRYN